MDSAISDVMNAQTDATRYQIAMKVAAKSKSVQEEQGEALVKMIKDAGASVQSARTASGGIDTYA